MKLTSLTLKRIEIPFRVSFSHASAERSETESVWVEARSETGEVGFGEGCPRSYVTGEDLESVRAFFLRSRASLMGAVTDLSSLVAWMNDREAELDLNPAAWCAIELALLDLAAREEGSSVETLLGTPELAREFQYTAVMGDSDPEGFQALFRRYRDAGFTDFKLKLSGDLDRDRAKIACIRGADAPLRVRVDANNLWADRDEAASFLAALDYDFFGIEEPLGTNQHEALSALARSADTRIILDESLLRARQVDALPGPAERWIINLRVSKMGGLIRGLEVVEATRSRGIQIVVGAQVGETSLLTRAALTIATAAGDLLVGQEGAFGSLLLEADVCDPPLMFGESGVLQVDDAQRSPGLGLQVPKDLPFLHAVDDPG